MALNLDTLGLSATVTAQGISAPDYQTILDTLTSYFRQIYGSDAYLEPDSKDGQMVALVALAVHDANNTAIGIYNSFSPTTAQAAALSSNVKINGITRKVATNSTADLLLTGTAGTTITNGSARDKNGIIWNFPASVAIGVDGTVLVTATCANSGSVPWPSATPPTGWLKCNGAAFSAEEYPELAKAYPTNKLPDLRGEFIRGWDDGRGVDAGRQLLSSQGDAIRNIEGFADGGIGMSFDAIRGAFYDAGTRSATMANNTTAIGKTDDLGFDASRVVPTANENRPRNIAFNYIVRAA